MARIYGKNVAIDSRQVNQFFENRFCKENPLASVMLRPDQGDDIADRRNTNENALVHGFLKNRTSDTELRVLDMGCGMGRWIQNLNGCISSYVGVDFAENYIAAAREIYAARQECSFFHCSVTSPESAILKRQYDLIIINGLCVYLNDDDVETLFDLIAPTLARDGMIYFRESVSTTGERLTLKEFFSEELHADYNAIYRTPEEYERILAAKLPDIICKSTAYLLDESTGVRPETNQKYWLLQKA